MILFFHNHLSSLLHRNFRGQQKVGFELNRRASIKDIIESFGVPHTEIGRVTINDHEVCFEHIPNDNNDVDVFPLSGPNDFLTPTCLRPAPLSSLTFALDNNVGKLASLLRMSGMNTFYINPVSEVELLDIVLKENRILLSRNKDLLKRKALTFGYLVKNINPEKQLVEVIEMFDLKRQIKPFTRCMVCNGLLQKIDKQKIVDYLEPLTKIYYHTFHQCLNCGKLYWPGSHKEKMLKLLKRCFPDQNFSAQYVQRN